MTGRTDESSLVMRCRGCAYDLRGLAEHRCPECGRAFDPAKPETFLRRPVQARRLLFIAIASLPIMAWPIAVIRLGWIELLPIWLIPFGPISIITCLSMALEAVRRSINVLRGRLGTYPAGGAAS
jgi:hypothetical protein